MCGDDLRGVRVGAVDGVVVRGDVRHGLVEHDVDHFGCGRDEGRRDGHFAAEVQDVLGDHLRVAIHR